MTALKVEQIPPPSVFQVYISRPEPIFLLLVGLIGVAMGLFVVAVFGLSFTMKLHLPLLLRAIFLVLGAMEAWGSSLIALQSIGNILNFNCPTFVFSKNSLKIRKFDVPWLSIKSLTNRLDSNGRSLSTYVQVDISDAGYLPSSDLTETKIPFLFKKTKKRLALPANSLLIPLDGFDKTPGDLMVLLKRYWSNATGQPYEKQSFEEVYPQKKFSDFAKDGVQNSH